MIKELRLENFRGFEDHLIPLRPTTVVVGKNNAGKSTLVEALRLIALVASRYENLHFRSVPRWVDLPRATRGVSPSLKNMEIDLRTIFYFYGEPPGIISAHFESGATLKILVGRKDIYAVIHDPRGRIIKNKADARELRLPKVMILPQVAPVAKEERLLNPDYVRRAMSSSLASLHFRNQLHLNFELFSEFKAVAEASWPGLRIRELAGRASWPLESNLSLIVQDGGFSAEVSWMGHGLQMWLQTVWFLVRARGSDTVILDEPDVYMHADLQRRLIRFVRDRFPQVIVATHSSEIMAEVEAEEVLVIDRSRSKSLFATSLPAVQKVLNSFGSVQNIHLTRLWNSRRFLILEGDDLTYLKRFQNRLHSGSEIPLDAIPAMSIGGWGGWNYAVGSSMFLENAGGEGILTYCILDSDFHTIEEIEERVREAGERGVHLHVWSRKEIENYLLVPDAICRVIRGASSDAVSVTPEAIRESMYRIAAALREDTLDAIATELLARNRGWTGGKANRHARNLLEKAFATPEGSISVVSGKTVLSTLSEWSKQTYNVSFGRTTVASELRRTEIPDEVRRVVAAIELARPFNTNST